jgi:hypothetical protein
MLQIYRAENKDGLTNFISDFMNRARGWAVIHDPADAVFPASFVVVAEHKIKLATIFFVSELNKAS